MFGTKFSGIAKAAARIAAAGAVGMAALAGAVLVVGPALPGHVAAPWVSTQPRIQAIGPVIPFCLMSQRYYDAHPGSKIPTYCQDPRFYQDISPPPGDAPPPPPGGAP
jgi:hypothetical protein